MIIRPFQPNYFPPISEIYRQGIATGLATFETVVPSWEEWNKKYLNACRLVAEEAGSVIGYTVVHPISKRECYSGVCEESIYIHEAWRGKGIGKKLLNALIEESECCGIWTLQAGIFAENKASILLHEQCGFRIIGFREKIAKLNSEWKDTILMERRSKNIL
jgi:phosphinothricin acetyltransferase